MSSKICRNSDYLHGNQIISFPTAHPETRKIWVIQFDPVLFLEVLLNSHLSTLAVKFFTIGWSFEPVAANVSRVLAARIGNLQSGDFPAEISVIIITQCGARARSEHVSHPLVHRSGFDKSFLRSVNNQKRLPANAQGLEVAEPNFNSATQIHRLVDFFGQKTAANDNSPETRQKFREELKQI